MRPLFGPLINAQERIGPMIAETACPYSLEGRRRHASVLSGMMAAIATVSGCLGGTKC